MTYYCPDADAGVSSYKTHVLWKTILIIIMVVAIVVLSGLSLTVGQNQVSFTDSFRLIYEHIVGIYHESGTSDWWNDIIVWDVRLPRTLGAVVAGAALALGGAAMQSIVKNPLADPYTTGISSGAVFGASIAIVLGMSLVGIGQYGLVINAFIFSLIPAALMIFMSRISNGSPVTIILVGTAVSFIFSAMTTLIQTAADEQALSDVFEWTIGSLTRVSWGNLPLMSVVTILGGAFFILTAGRMNLLMMGDDDAKSLGLNVENYRILCLIILSLMTASIVSFVGVIGFLGLVTPHMVRMLIGSDSHFVLPLSALLGSAILLVADIVSRAIAVQSMPVGVVMSFIGAPIFLYLIIKSKNGVWG